jgi:RNA polymerase-binding transcription factor DksA
MGTAIVDVLDDEFVETALTRAEVLRARGYDEHAELSSPVQLVPQARCAICSAAIPADRLKRRPTAKTCSNTCSYSLTRQRQQRYDKRWRAQKGKTIVALVDNGTAKLASTNGHSEAGGGTTSREAGSQSRLVSVVAGLVNAGLRLRLTVEGCDVEVTQR